jgi:hypothetical protein
MLLRCSRLSGLLTKEAVDTLQASGATVQALPGLTPGSQEGQDAEAKIVNGLEGRLLKPMVGGMAVRQTQGPRAYAPRLDKPSTGHAK